MKVFSPFLNGDTTTSGSLNLPQHPTSASISNPNTGSIYHDTTDNVVKIYTGNAWETVGAQTAPAPPGVNIEYLVVAGGGGASADSGGGAGGGAGGLLSSSLSSVTSGSTFTVTIGGGGVGYDGSNPAGEGTDSSIAGATISTITATGGGGAGSFQDTGTIYLGHDGGSGGGSGNGNANYTRPDGGSGTVGQGNDGGGAHSAAVNNGNNAAGGGGGAGAVGADAASGAGGNGGDGLQSSITGTSTYYAGGGAGGTRSSGTAGTGGQGGGGDANNTTNGTGQDGDANTGGGAGGSRSTPTAAGGSGVAIFAYDSGSINGAGGITGDAGNGRKYHQFNSTDTFKLGSTSDFQVVTDSLRIHLDAGDFASRGTSTWTDLSGNSHNATMTGTDLGSNYYYTYGSGDYGTITYNSNIQLSLGSSVEIWIKHANTSGGQLPLWMRNVGGICIGNVINAANVGYWTFAKYTTTWIDVKSSTGVDTNWHHLVGVVESSAIKIYVDGALEGTTSNSDAVITGYTYDQHVGGYQPDTASYSYYGDIGQYRMYNKALSAAEVAQNYEATKTNFV